MGKAPEGHIEPDTKFDFLLVAEGCKEMFQGSDGHN